MAGATALCLALIIATAAYARSAGDLDPSFGHHGLRIVRKANDPSGSQAVAVARKGRIVVAGGQTVARLHANGRLDRSFADGGIATLGPTGGGYFSLAVGRKGGIFVAEWYCAAGDRCGFAVTRLNRDGDLDRSFGDDGIARVNFSSPETFSPSIAIARGGKPVVTGLICRSYLHDCNLALARLDRHGRLDTSFGDHGKVVASVGPGGRCRSLLQLGPMTLDSRGRIVMGADCRRTVWLARFMPNGHLDHSFGRRGKVNGKHLPISVPTALTVDPKDRVDVAGPGPPKGFGVARFQGNGRLDSSFGNHGTAAVKFDEKRVDSAAPYSAAVDSRGRIVLAGAAFGPSFARFTPHGHVDGHFGRHGRVVIGRSVGGGSTGQGLYAATSVAIDRRDRIVASGIQRKNREVHFAVMRLLG